MADFTTDFWSLFVAAATLVSVVACGLLLVSMSRRRVATDPDKTGHVWDEDLDELNNALPMWWIGLFWITILFGLATAGLEVQIPPQVSGYASFMFSFLGRPVSSARL